MRNDATIRGLDTRSGLCSASTDCRNDQSRNTFTHETGLLEEPGLTRGSDWLWERKNLTSSKQIWD